ncbi:MAG: cysteine hydrolase [Methanoregula sp.]|nr:cysteine hydrolase [Methanoregula sp.]
MSQALLVIDVQNEYFTGKLPVTYPHGSIVNILQAMDAAHAARMPVIVIQHANRAAGTATFVPGTPAWELHPDVTKRPHDLLLEKTLPGSFTGTHLDAWLKERGITTVTIAGYMTQMCCDTTARQAFHHGYSVQFLSDATGTLSITNSAGAISDTDLQRAILVTQQMRFSQVMTTAAWIQSLPISYQ